VTREGWQARHEKAARPQEPEAQPEPLDVHSGGSDVIEALKAHPSVTKIVLGVIDPGRRPAGLSARDVPAGLKVFVRGNGAVQTLFVYTTDRTSVRVSLGLA
jgi:hypothetical protein